MSSFFFSFFFVSLDKIFQFLKGETYLGPRLSAVVQQVHLNIGCEVNVKFTFGRTGCMAANDPR